MTAGVPGTGVTALFYLLLVILMPVREAYLTIRGRSSLARWRTVGHQSALTLGIILLLWAEGWALAWLIGPPEPRAGLSGRSGLVQIATHNVLTVSMLLAASVTLTGIWIAVHFLRLVFRTSGRRTVADQSAADLGDAPVNGSMPRLEGSGAG